MGAGPSKYRPTMKYQIISTLKKKQVVLFSKQKHWDFIGDTQKPIITDIFVFLENSTTSFCQKMTIKFFHQNSSINVFKLIKCLQNICFRNLQWLVISKQNIIKRWFRTNIQFLTQMDSKVLKQVFIYDKSKVLCFQKSIRKSTFPNLQIMNIQNNRISQGNKLSQLYMKHDFESLIIEMYLSQLYIRDPNNVLQIRDLSFLCKLNTQSIQKLRIQSNYRIKQILVLKMIKEKKFAGKQKNLKIFT